MRLITRLDFDGIVCTVLLLEKGLVDDFKFAHPKDIQDGLVPVTSEDILANVPYVPGCGLWFDHHASEDARLGSELKFEGASRSADSAAQVIWDYYGGTDTFDPRFRALLDAVNKSDSANLTSEEILNPQGWILLSFIADPRTGLGRFSDFRINHYHFLLNLIQQCRTLPVEEILALHDVHERAVKYFEQQELFQEMLKRCCQASDNAIVTNLIDEEPIYAGNRFLVYALYPEQNIEIRMFWGKERQNVVFAVGHSIVNRTSRTNVGELMLRYGGGGHLKVGTCQVPVADWRRVREELIEQVRRDG